MKLMIKIALSFFTLLVFSECKSSQKIATIKHPFKIESATFTDWVGGIKKDRGTTIEILVTTQEVIIDTLYFRGNKIVPELKKVANEKLQIVGNIINKEKQVLVMHLDPKQEYGNKPPVKIDTNFPFQLVSDELVIGYTKNEKFNYFKIKLKIKKLEMH